METVNEQLQELYRSNLPNIESIFNSGKNIDGPHLMHCWDDAYNNANKKILFIGKEPTGWAFRDYLGYEIDIAEQTNPTGWVFRDYLAAKRNLLEDCIGCYKMIVKDSGSVKHKFWSAIHTVYSDESEPLFRAK